MALLLQAYAYRYFTLASWEKLRSCFGPGYRGHRQPTEHGYQARADTVAQEEIASRGRNGDVKEMVQMAIAKAKSKNGRKIGLNGHRLPAIAICPFLSKTGI